MSGVQSARNFYHSRDTSRLYTWSTFISLFVNAIVHVGSIRLFADDTSLYITVKDPNVAAELLKADLIR